MKITVVNQTKKHKASKTQINEKDLGKVVAHIISYFKTKKIRNKALLKEKNELTLVFLSLAEMKAINTRYRNKNKATDILSFASSDPKSLGELLLCLPVLEKQAKQNKHSLKSEITYMLTHGILHLLGYDHELSKKEEKLMFAIQDKYFSKFFLSDT